jgi:putative ABC transport system permease protein
LPGSVRRGVEAVTPRYFDALGASLTLGRVFTDADRDGAAPVAVVNEELVRHLWPNRNPIGETLRLGSPAEAAPVVTVIGVVTTIRRSGMHDQPIARVYVPFAQYPNASLSLVVRGRSNVAAATRELQTSVGRLDRTLFVENLRTVDADVAQFLAPVRLVTSLLTGFGVVGLFLAGLGVFGAMSYMVSQRQREMAVRAALGAHQRDIVRLVFSSALRVTALGIIAGTMAALAGTRVLSSYLFGVSPTDLPTFVAAIGFLVLVSLAACYRPARVAATSDPMQLLRG